MVKCEEKYFNGEGYYEYIDFSQHVIRARKLVGITRAKSVLDVGCAYGYIVRHLLDMGIPAMGCDISKYCEKRAEEIIPDAFCLCPAWDLGFQDKSFDVIYCEGVLEHVPEDKVDKVFKEFARVADRFYLQVSFIHHKDAEKEVGHVCLQTPEWWYNKMPMDSWLALGYTGTEDNIGWLYKG